MGALTFQVRAEAESATRTRAEARQFALVIDEPPALGGTDAGANPVEYVLAAFGGCLNVMGHLIAKEKGMELRGLRIHLEGDLDPDRLFGRPTEERAGYSAIRVRLEADTEAEASPLEEWRREVCERCPVCDNLKHPTPVEVVVERSASGTVA